MRPRRPLEVSPCGGSGRRSPLARRRLIPCQTRVPYLKIPRGITIFRAGRRPGGVIPAGSTHCRGNAAAIRARGRRDGDEGNHASRPDRRCGGRCGRRRAAEVRLRRRALRRRHRRRRRARRAHGRAPDREGRPLRDRARSPRPGRGSRPQPPARQRRLHRARRHVHRADAGPHPGARRGGRRRHLSDLQHGNNVFYGPRGREEYPNDTPLGTAPADPVVAPDIVLAVAQLDQMSTSVPVDRPWESSSAEQWDRQTLDTWLRANTSGSDEFMAVSSAATEAIFGCEPRELSLLYTLFYITASGNEQNPGTFERNFNTAGGAQESRFVGGAQTIALRVADQLGTRVRLTTPVTRIEQSFTRATVYSNGHRCFAQRVIVAIQPTLAGRIQYDPPLPPLRDQLTQHMPQGSLMKFEAIYPTPFWRANGLNGQVVSEIGPRSE